MFTYIRSKIYLKEFPETIVEKGEVCGIWEEGNAGKMKYHRP